MLSFTDYIGKHQKLEPSQSATTNFTRNNDTSEGCQSDDSERLAERFEASLVGMYQLSLIPCQEKNEQYISTYM